MTKTFHPSTRLVLTLTLLTASVGASFWAGLQANGSVQPLKLVEAGPQEMPGDMNDDGSITAADANLILEVVRGYREDTAELRRRDPNGNGQLTIDDAMLILSRL